jgi:EDD domain protein, DegV family
MNKSNIVLVAETGSDTPAEWAKEHGVYIVPMHVTFDDVTLDDGAFPVEDIVAYYKKTGKVPKTSASTPEDFTKVFDEIHAQWPEKHILHLAYSAQTTASYHSAVIAAEGRDYVTSIDTKQVSVGQAAVVMQMAQILEETPDITLETAVAAAEDLSNRVHMSFLPDNLAFLRAGGRVSNAAYMGSRLLNLHPCIEIIDGLLQATKKYRGNLLKIIPDFVKDSVEQHNFNKDIVYLGRTIGVNDETCSVLEKTVKEYGFKDILWVDLLCVITTHGGPGAFGFVGISEPVTA